MGRLMVITTPDLAPGFQLAGVETFAVASVAEAETVLRDLMDGAEASLIVVRRALLQEMDFSLQRRVENSFRPVVMSIPGSISTSRREGRRRYISELIRRAIGFHITFGNEQPETSSRDR